LASVEMTELNDGTIKMSDVKRKLAPDFLATFRSLLSVMSIQEIKKRAKQAKAESQSDSHPISSGSTVTTRKRPLNNPITSAPKRAKPPGKEPSPQSEPRTPEQPTHPSDPDFTGASGASTESKDEENTKKLMFHLLMDTLSVFEDDFLNIVWQKSGYLVELNQTLVLKILYAYL
jgi:hypothetical protein